MDVFEEKMRYTDTKKKFNLFSKLINSVICDAFNKINQ